MRVSSEGVSGGQFQARAAAGLRRHPQEPGPGAVPGAGAVPGSDAVLLADFVSAVPEELEVPKGRELSETRLCLPSLGQSLPRSAAHGVASISWFFFRLMLVVSQPHSVLLSRVMSLTLGVSSL